MLAAPCHIISDTHIGATPATVERSFESYLRALPGMARSLVINGDLFDFWFEWKTVIPRRGFRVLAELARLRDQGVEILWIAGNHDCWGGEVLARDVGVTYQVGVWEGDVAGWRTRLEHGDGLREVEDRRYRMIRPIMRSPLAIRAFRALHPDLATRIATGSSEASRTHRALDGGAGLRAIAHSALRADPSLELLVLGHSHVAALESVPGAGVFANAGSWLESPTFLRVTPESVQLRTWTGSAEGDCLDVVDRGAKKTLPDA